MSDRMAIALAQLNPTSATSRQPGKARKRAPQAAREGADIVLFSELFLIGYPPEDLVLKPALQDRGRGRRSRRWRRKRRERPGDADRHAVGRRTAKLYNAVAYSTAAR